MKIAIKGHELRGKEVIQILESLGGKNVEKLTGTYKTFYYINDENEINDDHKENFPLNYRLYTLEEFEDAFPFKVGDKVIFPVEIGWWSGTITSLTSDFKYQIKTEKHGYLYIESHKLSLYPMQEERNITLTLDKAKEWYNKGGELREIALQAFTEKELNPLPRSWEEFCRNNPVQVGECWLENCDEIRKKELSTNEARIYKNWIPSRKSAEAHLAMIQLEQLRDCWRNGWVPTPGESYYVIKLGFKGLDVYRFCTVEFLSFPIREMAEEFLECFRDLIEKAGDLI